MISKAIEREGREEEFELDDPVSIRLAPLERQWLAGKVHRPTTHLEVWEQQGLQSFGEDLLGALTVYLEMAAYPPPELLLAIVEQYETYLSAKGSVNAEDVFFGKPRRKSGNYSARQAAQLRDVMFASEIAATRKKGETDVAAAERIIRERNLSIDADSLLRRIRKYWKPQNAKEK